MKNSLRKLIVLLAVVTASTVLGGGMSPVMVTVSDEGGHVAYKGKTNASGSFATGKLQPGDYVVQFNSGSMPQGNYALLISAGKQKVAAESVASTKFAKGGVAMKLKVGKDMNVTGMVSSGKAGGDKVASGNTKVKVVNGKRYVWVGPQTGSNMGGHWVEEGEAGAYNIHTIGEKGVQDMQDRGLQGGIPGN